MSANQTFGADRGIGGRRRSIDIERRLAQSFHADSTRGKRSKATMAKAIMVIMTFSGTVLMAMPTSCFMNIASFRRCKA